jgi:hypothetical protein
VLRWNSGYDFHESLFSEHFYPMMKCDVHVSSSIKKEGRRLLRKSLETRKIVARIAEKPILRHAHGSAAGRAQPEISFAVSAKRGDFVVRESVFFRKCTRTRGAVLIGFPLEEACRSSEQEVSSGVFENARYDDALLGDIDTFDPEFIRCIRHNPEEAIPRSRPQPAFSIFENNIPKKVHTNRGLAEIFRSPAVMGAAVEGTNCSDPEISATIFKERNHSFINRRLPGTRQDWHSLKLPIIGRPLWRPQAIQSTFRSAPQFSGMILVKDIHSAAVDSSWTVGPEFPGSRCARVEPCYAIEGRCPVDTLPGFQQLHNRIPRKSICPPIGPELISIELG